MVLILSQDFIERVKNATDMLILAKRYSDLKQINNRVWQGKCPHPNHKDDTPSFNVWEKSQSWSCMACHSGKKGSRFKNYGSDCFAFMQWIENMSWYESVTTLAKEAGIELEKEKYEELYNHNKILSVSYNSYMANEIFEYLKTRGLDKSDIENWLIGFNGSSIIFPLFDNHKKILGFSKRNMKKDNNAKYKNTHNNEIFNKGSYLYGIHLLDRDFDEIRITEGCLDVILSNKYGVKNIVCSLGTSFTEKHVDLIKNLKKTPVFCMDGDAPGLKSIERSVELLSQVGVYSKIVILPKDMDMADLSNHLGHSIENYIVENSITYGQMIIQNIINKYDAKNNEIKLKLYPEIKEAMTKVKDEDEKLILASYIENRMGLKF